MLGERSDVLERKDLVVTPNASLGGAVVMMAVAEGEEDGDESNATSGPFEKWELLPEGVSSYPVFTGATMPDQRVKDIEGAQQ